MFREWIHTHMVFVDPEPNMLHRVGRGILLLGLAWWTWKFGMAPLKSNYAGGSFMHVINLPFHEAGHIVFAPLGRFLQVLGGTIGQLLIPCLCLGTFLFKTRDPFGAAVCLWWLGENFLDIAPYINDARDLDLILLGGVTGEEVEGYHDWQYILGSLGWLQYDHLIAKWAHGLGLLMMVLSLLWGLWILRMQTTGVMQKGE